MSNRRHVELRGDGARALRAFLAQHEASGSGALGSDDSGALTAPQLQLAATLLRRLRREDPTVPTLASFLHSRVRVVAATDASEPPTEAAVKKSAADEAYMARRRQKLLRLDEEMRYSRLVRNVKSKTRAGELEQFQTSTRQHLSIGANMIAARVTAFVVLYMVARVLTDSETMRVVVGLGGAIGMMVIEMVLFITRATKYEALEREQRRRGPSAF